MHMMKSLQRKHHQNLQRKHLLFHFTKDSVKFQPETGTHKKLQSLVSLHQVTDTLVVELLSHKLKLHHPTGMIKNQKFLVTQHQETSTLQQDKDLHIIQKPKNSVLGLMMLLQVIKQNLLHLHHHLHHHNLNLRQVLEVHLMENQNKRNLKTMKKITWHV